MKFGVIVFPGSNCDDDMVHVLGDVMGCEVVKLWHKQSDLGMLGAGDCVVLPGGFSFGDYVRAGAIAHLSPIMQAVKEFADSGQGYVFGVCNGFQILCESGLLPGVLLRNSGQQFICSNVFIRAETNNSMLTSNLTVGQPLNIPIAHAEGRFYADEKTLDTLEQNDQVLFRYCDAAGQVSDLANPNGASRHIAGVCNEKRNVFGMMPHPERASEDILANTDGRGLFESLLQAQTLLKTI
ncbi:MAG: phosphoribosylformylglycinamidine synthase subunit PurQ [Saprospiraceae bacterium]|nr:phosphoribosylformylglycinamidine synthase subunit PurQ [Saprospiraceae bacterium]